MIPLPRRRVLHYLAGIGALGGVGIAFGEGRKQSRQNAHIDMSEWPHDRLEVRYEGRRYQLVKDGDELVLTEGDP